jgi:type I site-specific restriction-modification system R (restriction) subunit
MTKITFKPWEEIVIHETIKRRLKDLVKLKTLYFKKGQTSEIFLWAEGVVFVRTPMPPSDDVIRDQLKGVIHYSSVEFAKMPKYKRAIMSEGITVPIVDVSDTPALREVAKELKKQL